MEGFRARSAYKLLQINTRYNIIGPGDRLVDLGAAPGGWSQVALEIVGPEGRVVAVDIQRIEPLEGLMIIKGDVRKPQTVEKIIETAPAVDAVISDMSPNISGHYSMDHARSVELAQLALYVAKRVLKSGGNFLVKVFQGDLFEAYFGDVESAFEFSKAHSPKASRKQSSEIYVIGKGFSI